MTNRARARRADLAEGTGSAASLEAHLGSALRTRRSAARARRQEGPGDPRIRGDHLPRPDARRGHPLGAGRDRGRSNLNAGAGTPALSVVVPVYNEGENVVPTLRGIVEQSHTR